MNIKEIKLSELHPYEKNPRKNDEAVRYVVNSIKSFGFRVPLVIDKDNVIVCGHTRYKAAVEMGMETVPCVIADDLSPEQIKAYRLADNKVAEKAEWDIDLLDAELADILEFDMTDFGFDELVDSLGDETEDINDEDLDAQQGFEHKLRFDKTVVIMTDDEYNALSERYKKYIDEHGVSFGFVSDLLGG